MIALSLAEIAAVLKGELRLFGDHTADTVVDGLVDTDSRQMAPGTIFVAKPGATTDGHAFVGKAAESGAVLAIVERPVEASITQIVVADA
ncbi:MAG TPA: Mur ligase domain-containing protein, partial [Microbacterium sp.]|nr:Mur ligase domain-containing protein [Microbacterium sp.]